MPPLPVAAGYDRWASTYDTVVNATRDASADHLRSQPFELKGARVLELGCGTGINTVWLAQHAAQVTAVDFSPRMLEQARQRIDAAHVSFIAHDIVKPLPLDDGSVDLVVVNLVLEHVQDLAAPFAEIHRVLQPKGAFTLCELHPYRQLMGTQARFLDLETDTELLIEAWPHTIAEFVNTALRQGFAITRLDEEAYDPSGFPRLFSLTATRN